jgi:TRAP-type C4-dicarboxylate transport system substrate-binding protein
MRKRTRLWAAGLAFALVATACGGDDEVADDVGATATADDATEATDPETVPEDDTEAAAEDLGPAVELTLGHPFPASHVIQAKVLDDWVQEVSDATGGTVDIEIVPGGGLGPPPAMYENTVAGAQDLGWALHGYTAGRFPLMQIVEMPFAFNSAEEATETLWDLYEEFPAFQDEYSDVHVVGLWTHDTGDLWTSSTQVTTMEDMSGLSLRAPGPIQQDLINELGGSPVGMPAPEIFDSMERGVIDGLLISNSGVDSFGLYDVIDFGVDCDCYVAAMFLVINQSTWDSLSPEQQAAVDALSGREFSLRAARAYDEDSDANQRKIEDAGIEMTEPSGDELTRWKDVGRAVADKWVQEREGAGQPGQAMYDRLLELTGQ